MKLLVVIVAMAIGNFLFEAFQDIPSYLTAFEHTYFMWAGVVVLWFSGLIKRAEDG